MSSWNAIRLVARREIRERVKGNLLRVMTILSAVLVVLLIVVPSHISQSSGKTATVVGLVGPGGQALGPAIQATATALGDRVTTTPLVDSADEQAHFTLGTVDVALRVQAAHVYADVESGIDGDVQTVIEIALARANLYTSLEATGVPAAAIDRALAPTPFTVRTLAPSNPDQSARAAAAIAAAAILYVSLLTWGGQVAQGVAQEKTSRIAEVLVSAITPNQLLTGKVIGIGALAIGQVTVAAGAGLITNAVVHSAVIPQAVWALLPAAVLWFLLGFAFYSLMFATAGALVARQEEVAMVGAPFSIVIVAAYLVTFLAVGSPDASWVRVISYIPPLAPIFMPVRIAVGSVAWWETPLMVLVMVLMIVVVARIAGGIYRVYLVRGGARVPWSIALGWYAGERVR